MRRLCDVRVGGLALVLGALWFASAPAEAQLSSSFYVVTNVPGSYAPLGSAGSSVKKVTGTNQGAYSLSLSGWTFPFFSDTYSSIWIDADGFLAVTDSSNSSTECGCENSNGTCEFGENYCQAGSPNCGGGCCIKADGTCNANYQNNYCSFNYEGCCDDNYNSCNFYSNYAPPTSKKGTFDSNFGGTIAAWWRPLDDTPSKGISYLAGGATGSHSLTVDYHGVWDSYYEEYQYAGGQYNFAVTLFESGIVEVDYGTATNLAPNGYDGESAWTSIASQDETTVVAGPSCATDPYWSYYSFGFESFWECTAPYTGNNFQGCGCIAARFPHDTTVFYGQPAGVAFYPQTVTPSNGVEDQLNSKLTFDVDTLALNIGLSAVSGGFTDNLYLESGFETSDKLDGTCASLAVPGCVATTSQSTTIPAAPGAAAALATKHVSMTLPTDGIYTLEEWFDPANSTSNGLAGKLGSAILEVGVDLTGSIGVTPTGGIPGPTGPCLLPGRMGTGPGGSIPITFQNLGSRVAPNTTYRLYASKTNTLPFDPTAAFQFPTADGTVNLGGFDTQGPQCLPVTIPSIAEGDYYLVLQMDPDGAYPNDINLANNIVFTPQTVHISPPHLRVSGVVGPAKAYQGRPTDIGFTLASDGASDANGFSIGLMLVPQGGSLTTTSYKVAQIDGVSLKSGCTIQVQHGVVVFSSSNGCYVWPSTPAVEVVPPNAADGDSRMTPPGIYNAGVIADITDLVLPRQGRDTNHLEAPTTTVVQLPLPDFAILAGDINAPTSALAGSQILVERNIRNVGVSASSTTYGYYLNLNGSPDVLEVNQGGVPIPVVLPTGELTYTPTVSLDYPGHGQSEDRGADLLVIPSTLAPPTGAKYTLALVLDPINAVTELDKSNNMAGVGPITVTRTDLAIASANPPSALPAVPYSFTFSASGGFGAYSWSILAGALPAPMTLSADGVLSGTPTDLGVWTILLEVSSGGQTQVASVAFTVAPPSGPLQLVKSGLELPPATVGEVYAAQLAAQGGTPPYSWSAKPSSLPDGLNLSPSGLLSGTPTPMALTTNGAAVVAVTVTDQAGNTKFDTYLLEVVGPGALVITTTDIPPQLVNQPWLQDLSASGCKGTCHWTIPSGQLLPPGLQMTNQGTGPTAVGHLSGTLTQSGIWFFEVQVTDDSAHLATRHYRLQVGGSVLTLPAQQLPGATVGQTYSAQLVGPSGVTVTWLLYSGDLPPTLTLTSAGSISGTVSATAGVRTYAFTVSAQDSQGNESLLAQAIQVTPAAVAKKSGCSTGGGGLMPFGVLGLGLLLSRRRKSPAGVGENRVGSVVLPAVLGLCFFLGGTARAAVLGGYYPVSGNPERWSDITQMPSMATLYSIPTTTTSYGQTISLPFANGFTYNGNTYATLSVASNGFASFGTISSSYSYGQQTFPAATILSPWWGGTGVCYDNASVSWATEGSEPDLTVIVQWENMSYDHSGTNDCSGTDVGRDLFSFQLRLHESGQINGVNQNGVIDFLYGNHISAAGNISCGYSYSNSNAEWCQPSDYPAPPCTSNFGYCYSYGSNSCLFSSGLEDDSNNPSGMIALQCGASCAHNVFPLSGTLNLFTSGPDLQIGLVDVLGQFSPGLGMTGTVQVANVAPNPAASASTGAETVDLFLSHDCVTADSTTPLATTPPVPALAPGAAPATVSVALTLPQSAQVGQVECLLAVLHEPPGNTDVDPIGKTGASNPLVVAAARPDLVAGPLNSAGSGSPGNSILLVPSVSNIGNADAPAGIPYAYYLAPATAQSVSPTDLQIGIAQVLPAIAVGAQAPPVQDTVDLPVWLPAGTYRVGIIIDPGNTAAELSKQNNGSLSTTLLKVSDNGLQIATTAIPYGYIGGPYQAQLTAEHGLGPYIWTVAALPDNPMPAGLTLSATGEITGTPSAVFNARVVFQVVDSSTQQETATKPLVFNIVATQLPLTVVTEQLPTGGFNSQYLVQLIAIGGQWPYQWSMVTGAGLLPPGMALGADGTLTGVPTQAGAFSFQVQVTDSARVPVVAQSTRFNMQVASPGLVTLASSQLPVGVVGEPYVGVLRAAGGSMKYDWTLINDLQLPDGPGSTTKNWNNVEPPGFNKIALNGQVNGQPSQAGLFALSVQAQEVLPDNSLGASATDTVLLRVVPADGLYIKNSSLPDATVGLPYSAKLETNAVSSVGSVFFQPVDGSGQDTSAARQSIPAGLTLNQDGTLGGTPRSTGRYLFLVQAIDQAQNRSTISALSLNVADTVATVSSGCATSPRTPAASSILLALIGLAALRRRRRVA